MTSQSLLPTMLRGFFEDYLAAQRDVSPNTILAYRDAIKLLPASPHAAAATVSWPRPAETAPARCARHLDLPDCRGPRQAVPPDGQNANPRLVTTKSFAKGIVKLTYELQR
jgi:hypothetical protein